MDEQRILAEIEQHLADDDPLLAARLASFGRRRWHARPRRPLTPRPGRSPAQTRLRRTSWIATALAVAGLVLALLAATLHRPPAVDHTAGAPAGAPHPTVLALPASAG